MCLLQPPGYPKPDTRAPLPHTVDIQADLCLFYCICPRYSDTLTPRTKQKKKKKKKKKTCLRAHEDSEGPDQPSAHPIFVKTWGRKPGRLMQCIPFSCFVFYLGFMSLRKHAYSIILKILPPKNENFLIKNSDIFF